MAELIGFQPEAPQPLLHDPLQLIEQIETYAQNIVDTVREPLLILDTTCASDLPTAPSTRLFTSLPKKPRTD